MRFLFKQLCDQAVFIKHTLPQISFIRWWRSVINNLENLVNWLQRRLIDEYFNQDALDLTFQVNNFMATANQDLRINTFEWAEQLYNCAVWMSSGGLINTCQGGTKDFSEISTAPFDPQIALAVCPTNILLRPTCSSKNELVVRFIVFLVVFLHGFIFYTWYHHITISAPWAIFALFDFWCNWFILDSLIFL